MKVNTLTAEKYKFGEDYAKQGRTISVLVTEKQRLEQQITADAITAKTTQSNLQQEIATLTTRVNNTEQRLSTSAKNLAAAEGNALHIKAKLNEALKKLETKPMSSVVPAAKLQEQEAANASLTQKLAELKTSNEDLEHRIKCMQ